MKPWVERALAKLEDLMLARIVPPGGNFDCGPLLEKLPGCDTLMGAAALRLRFDRQCMMRYAGEAIDRDNPYTREKSNTVLPWLYVFSCRTGTAKFFCPESWKICYDWCWKPGWRIKAISG